VSEQGEHNARLFLSRVRDHYVDQLLLFIADQRRNSIRGESEVKIELEPGSPVFRSLACADFVRNDGEPEIVEFEPERALGFDPIDTTLGGAQLRIVALRWDDVVIDHDGSFEPEVAVGNWFDRWFDPDDRRHRPSADLQDVVHSVIVEPGRITIDFGSAQPEAFWEMLNLIEKSGARRVRIDASRSDQPAATPA